MQLQTSTRWVGDILIVDCDGRIVFGDETTFLRHQVKDFVAEHHQIILNLADVNYIDSTGLGTLVGLFTFARRAGNDIVLAGLTGKIKDLLQITKLVTVFLSFDTVEAALAHFRRSTETATATR
jgi:anti-sigma B factor antagonist